MQWLVINNEKLVNSQQLMNLNVVHTHTAGLLTRYLNCHAELAVTFTVVAETIASSQCTHPQTGYIPVLRWIACLKTPGARVARQRVIPLIETNVLPLSRAAI